MDDKELKPGRELDTLVAEQVMGWEVRSWPKEAIAMTDEGYINLWDVTMGENSLLSWSPSTRIYDAWEVVERLIASGYGVGVTYDSENDRWLASLYHGREIEFGRWGDTTPHAICLMALVATQQKEEGE